MKLEILTVAAVLSLVSAQSAIASDSVVIRDAAARVVVIAEARNDIQVSVQPGRKSLPPMHVSREGDRVIVDGGLGYRIKGCGYSSFSFGDLFHHQRHEHQERGGVTVSGIGHIRRDELPLITVRVPYDAKVEAGGAVFGQVSPTRNLQLAVSGCGDWKVSDVQSALDLSASGSGDVAGHHVGTLHAALSGSGDLVLDRVDGMAQVRVSGSADVRIASSRGLQSQVQGSGDIHLGHVDGPIHSQVAGSGDVEIEGGQAPEVDVQLAGSGDFHFGGNAGSVTASVAGSGDVVIAHAAGPVSQSRAGSGEIHIGR